MNDADTNTKLCTGNTVDHQPLLAQNQEGVNIKTGPETHKQVPEKENIKEGSGLIGNTVQRSNWRMVSQNLLSDDLKVRKPGPH